MTVEAVKEMDIREEAARALALEIRNKAKARVLDKMRQLAAARKVVRNLEAELEAIYLEAQDDVKGV
jgi:hypothetical protein